MRRLRFAPLFLFAALATSMPAPAFAQGLSAQEEASARFQTGLKYYDAHDFESARLAFTQAYAVLQKPSILLNLALSELYSNHPVAAIGHFEQYIADASTPPDKREKAKKHLDEALKKTGHLEIRTDADAEVTLDGRALPRPLGTVVHVVPGTHALEARLGGKRTKTASVAPKAGETVAVDLAFESEAPPATPPAPATAPSDADVTSPPFTPPPAPIDRGPSPAWWILPGALGVVAVGGLVTGVGFASAQDASLEDAAALRGGSSSNICADRASPQCQAYEEKLSDASTQESVSRVGYYGGAIAFGLGAIAAVALIVWPRSSKSAALGLMPIVGTTNGGSVGLTF